MITNEEDMLRVQAATKEIQAVLAKHFGAENEEFIFEEVLGNVIAQYNYNNQGIANGNLAGWTMDAYLARSLEPHMPRIARLVDWLVEQGATAQKPFDAENCDRYAAVLFDAEVTDYEVDRPTRIVAFQTQSLTYLLKLTERQCFPNLAEHADQSVKAWGISLRYCTISDHSQGYCRPSFASLTSEYLEPYFRYGDGRDRGFLLEAEPRLCSSALEAKDAAWVGLKFLQGFLFDLHCHASMVPQEQNEHDEPKSTSEPSAQAPGP